MFQKLLDPGLNYEYLGEHSDQDITYEIVKVSFSSDTKPQDIYQLYINRETGLIDQFLFTVAEYGVVETPLLMRVEYEEVDGLLLPTRRKYQRSTWDAETTDEPWISANWTDIRFNNGLHPEDFTLN